MKRVFIALVILVVIYSAYVYFRGNLIIDIISANQLNREVNIKVNSEVLFEGVVEKSKGDFIQDVTRIGRTYFPRMIEVEVMTPDCEVEKESFFVFIPQTVEVIIRDNCEVEFQRTFGRVAYF